MNEQNDRNKIIDKLTRKAIQLDDICSSIYVVLLAKKSLRFNELYRSVIKLNPKQSSGKPFVSRPSFNDHLKHLTKQKLVIAKKKGKQNVTYTLNKETMSIFSDDSADITGWIEFLEKELGSFNAKEHYKKLTEKELEQEINRDLNEVMKVNLHELKAFVNYGLKTDESETDAEFWRFIGNPLYRILEKSIAEKCRNSIEYRKKLFDKLEFLLKREFLLKTFDDKSEV